MLLCRCGGDNRKGVFHGGKLLQDLKDLKEALKEKEYEKAEKMVDKLIDDTQSGIEDN